jgi:hypothetical protein
MDGIRPLGSIYLIGYSVFGTQLKLGLGEENITLTILRYMAENGRNKIG